MGGISPDLMEQAKQAMLAENMDFSEESEPSARSGAGYPSMGGFIEQHFDFAQADPDLEYLHKQLKSAMKGRDSGRKNSSQARVDGLRAQIKKKLKLDKIAAAQLPACCDVYNDPRGGSDSDYAEEGDTRDFSRCQRSDGSYYGTGGTCRKGTEAGAKQEEPKKARAKKSKGGGGKAESGGGGGALSKADSFDLRSTMKGNSGSPEKEKAEAEKELRRRIAEHEKKGYKKSDAIDSAKKTLAKYEQYDKEGGRTTSEGTRQAVGKLEYALDQAT